MKIRITTKNVAFSMPIPLSMAGFAIRSMPESVFEEMRRKAPEPYALLICRENLLYLYEECKDVLMAYKGLEIIHAEGHDEMFISVII